jgi:hypothetical protein
MNENELLPCPFCGGKAKFVSRMIYKDPFYHSDIPCYHTESPSQELIVFVECNECHAALFNNG